MLNIFIHRWHWWGSAWIVQPWVSIGGWRVPWKYSPRSKEPGQPGGQSPGATSDQRFWKWGKQKINNKNYFSSVEAEKLKGECEVMCEVINLALTPAFPQMAAPVLRLRTFRLWPLSLQPSPQQLSDAGFFYTGQFHWFLAWSYFKKNQNESLKKNLKLLHYKLQI